MTVVMNTEHFKIMRKRKKLTQEALGERLGVARTTVVGWERGDRTPDAEMLGKIADVLETTVDELLGREQVQPTPQERFLISLETLKQIRDQIANGEVEDIPEERIPFMVDKLDSEIAIIERNLKEQK